jgi:TonB family protein
MRRNVHLLLAVLTGCTVGAPPGFSGGDHWVFPLVGPLEDGLIITPATVRGHGPYLFAIDPDANVSAIDQQVVVDASLLLGSGPRRVDESETGQIRFYAELRDLKIAGLAIDRRDVMVFPNRIYDVQGRQISGILGRDVIADSLVFGFDRDQGIATLSTVKAFQTPPDAIAISYEAVSSRSAEYVGSRASVGRERGAPDSLGRPSAAAVQDPLPQGPLAGDTPLDPQRQARNTFERERARGRPRESGAVIPVPRRLARARIGDAGFAMHLDLGAVTSQLPESRWPRAGLAAAEARLHLVDEAASRREVSKIGMAGEVVVGSAKATSVTFVPFVDQRWKTEGVEGALGLDFFQPYAVYAHWDRGTYYLKPRGDVAALTAVRIGRWGTSIPACPHLGCITAELVPVGGGVVLRAVRDAEAANRPLEVYLGVTPAAGKTVAPLAVELPAGVDQLTVAVPPEYAGATLAVLDASPFPRACASDRGCLAMLSGPTAEPVELSPTDKPLPAAPPAAAPRSVVIDKLHRITGEQAIPPSDDVKPAGKPLGAAIIRVCLQPDGKVATTKLVKSSGAPAYDEQLQSTIKATWSFEPVDIDGAPASVCTTATFLGPTTGD